MIMNRLKRRLILLTQIQNKIINTNGIVRIFLFCKNDLLYFKRVNPYIMQCFQFLLHYSILFLFEHLLTINNYRLMLLKIHEK